jgi:hypothetical protein
MRYVVLQAVTEGRHGPKRLTAMVEESVYEENLHLPVPFSSRSYFPFSGQEALVSDAVIVDRVEVESEECEARDYMPDVLVSE